MSLRLTLLSIAAPLALIGAVSLVGCATDDCSIAGPDWPKNLDFMMPDMQEYRAEITILARDRFSFLGMSGGEARTIERAELLEMLSILKDFSPRPWLIFRVSEDADCDSVRSLRNELERRSICEGENCISGEVWDRPFGPAVTDS